MERGSILHPLSLKSGYAVPWSEMIVCWNRLYEGSAEDDGRPRVCHLLGVSRDTCVPAVSYRARQAAKSRRRGADTGTVPPVSSKKRRRRRRVLAGGRPPAGAHASSRQGEVLQTSCGVPDLDHHRRRSWSLRVCAERHIHADWTVDVLGSRVLLCHYAY